MIFPGGQIGICISVWTVVLRPDAVRVLAPRTCEGGGEAGGSPSTTYLSQKGAKNPYSKHRKRILFGALLSGIHTPPIPVCALVSLSKNRSLRTSPQTGVAIPQLFRPEIDRFNLKTGGFPRQCAHWYHPPHKCGGRGWLRCQCAKCQFAALNRYHVRNAARSKNRTGSINIGQHRTIASADLSGSFAPFLQFQKREIHTVFPRF